MISPFSATDYFNNLLCIASQKKASDIHVEPQSNRWLIRIRLDGLLFNFDELSIVDGLSLTSRIKILAHLDISEKRLPQDGHWQDTANHMNYRVSTCPILYGEKLVIRCLRTQLDYSITSLGMTEEQQQLFKDSLQYQNGLIIITGPTGSGKTTSLYAALQHLNTSTISIASLEDPIEIPLQGINQTQIQEKIGLSFNYVLRALLRQDPDIIMIGEIRDRETAEIALTAAQTGHLVLATLHTGSAVETLARLLQLQIPTQLIVNCLKLIVSQRLVRRLCSFCNGGLTCKHCHGGYLGRTGIYELLPITEALIEILMETSSLQEVKKHLKLHHWSNLWQNGLYKVMMGITTLQELQRVLISAKLFL